MSNQDNSYRLYLPHKKKIKSLIVDDNKMDQLILKETLNKLGLFDIYTADDASRAKMMIWNTQQMRSPYELIFLDWKMPKVDGLTLFKELKNDPELSKVKFIMTTGVNDELEVKKALSSGVDDYIVKPFHLEIVYKKLKKLQL